MTDMKRRNTGYEIDPIGPIGAVATVPAEFISSAIFEVVQGVYHLSERIGRAARNLRRR